MATIPHFRRLRPLPPIAVEPEPRKEQRPLPVVPRGTSGIYDPDERVRRATARAMVRARHTVPMTCAWAECVDPDTGKPREFQSRLIDGKPERRACSANHRLKLWRWEMRQQGYVQVTVGGRTGWRTPEGEFFPYPSSQRRRPTRRRRRRSSPSPVTIAS